MLKTVDDRYLILKDAVIQTVAFFDIFNYPLTEIELWERIGVKCEFKEMIDVLKEMAEIEMAQGLYFLKGKKDNVAVRNEQYIRAQEKWKIALRAVRVLRNIFGVKMVAVCNNFSYKENSDVDVFIITKEARIWLTRFLVTLAMELTGLRRHGARVADKICLSFYVSEEGMDLERLLFVGEKKELSENTGLISFACNDKLEADPYFVFWMADLLPIYNDGVFTEFFTKNSWIKKVLPNFSMVRVSQRIRVEDCFFSLIIKKIAEIFLFGFIGRFFENMAKNLQQKKMSKNFYSLSKENDSRVVISDTVLKFHEEDRRVFYRDVWNKKICDYRK